MKIRGFEKVILDKRKYEDLDINLPKRASLNSAGYDFYSPIDVELCPGEQKIIWTDIKAYMQNDEVLQLHVRSSMGIKRGLLLSNGTGIIDQDYYSNCDNDGNIGIAVFNRTNEIVKIDSGERIAQGIFIKYLVADNGNTEDIRNGGIGSTNLK